MRRVQLTCIHADIWAPSVARRYVKLWGWEPLPHGTEQLLHNILQTLCAAPHCTPPSELRACASPYLRPRRFRGMCPRGQGLPSSGTHALTQAPSRVAIHAPRGAKRDTVAPDRVAVVEQRIVQQRWCRCRGCGQGQPFGREDQFHYPRCDRGDRTTSRRWCKCVTPVYEVRARFLRRCGRFEKCTIESRTAYTVGGFMATALLVLGCEMVFF